MKSSQFKILPAAVSAFFCAGLFLPGISTGNEHNTDSAWNEFVDANSTLDANENLGRTLASGNKKKQTRKAKKVSLNKQNGNLRSSEKVPVKTVQSKTVQSKTVQSKAVQSKAVQSKAPINDYRTKDEILAEMRRIQIPDNYALTNKQLRAGSPTNAKVEKMTLGGAVLDSEAKQRRSVVESESLRFDAKTPILYNPRITDRRGFELTPEKQTNLSLGCGYLSLLAAERSQSNEVDLNGAFSVCELGAVVSLPSDFFVRAGVDFIQGDLRSRYFENADFSYVDSKMRTNSFRDPELGIGYQFFGDDVSSILSFDVAISLGPNRISGRSDGMGNLVDSEMSGLRGGAVYIPSLTVFSSSAYPVRYGARVSYLISGTQETVEEISDTNGNVESNDKEFESGGNFLVPAVFVEMPLSAHRLGFSLAYVNQEESKSRKESTFSTANGFVNSDSVERPNQNSASFASGAIYGELKFSNAFSILPLFEYSRWVRSQLPREGSSRTEIFSGQLNLKASF